MLEVMPIIHARNHGAKGKVDIDWQGATVQHLTYSDYAIQRQKQHFL